MASCHGHCPCTHDWDCPYDRPTQVHHSTTVISGYSEPTQAPARLSRRESRKQSLAEKRALSRAFTPKPVKAQRFFSPVKGPVTRAISRSGNK